MNAFAFDSKNDLLTALNTMKIDFMSPEVSLDKCTIKVTTTITIDHGTWIETITIVEIRPCPPDKGIE